MLYRPFGKTGEMVSILGMGAMRLPTIDNKPDQIDIREATEMLHYCVDHGVNYVDTGYFYHSSSMGLPGASEEFLGNALVGGLRDKVMLATKLPPMLVKESADMERIFADQLKRLRTDHIDCYLLHGLNAMEWNRMREMGVLDFLQKAKAHGDIRFAGFSFHDEFPAFMDIVDGFDWDMCQIQYNFMDTDYQAGRPGLRHAGSKGMAVVVMEPLKGGKLASGVPEDVLAIWDEAAEKKTPAEWALRWVWDHKEVSCVLSGMNTIQDVQENVRSASDGLAGSLGRIELDLFERVCKVYEERQFVPCTKCNYCMPCPNGLNIPMLFGFRNDVELYGNVQDSMMMYAGFTQTGVTAKASDCLECGDCETACPQKIEIINTLRQCAEFFESQAPPPPPPANEDAK